jgi:hypothetical protein
MGMVFAIVVCEGSFCDRKRGEGWMSRICKRMKTKKDASATRRPPVAKGYGIAGDGERMSGVRTLCDIWIREF